MEVAEKSAINLPVGQESVAKDFTNARLQGVAIGRKAPEFTAKTVDGKEFKLSDQRGRFVLIDFWATWCAPCVAELPTVKKVYEEFGASGFTVVSISFDRNAETAAKYMREKEMPWTQIWAENGANGPLAQLYGVSGIPATFLIDPDGNIVAMDLRGPKLRATLVSEREKREPKGY